MKHEKTGRREFLRRAGLLSGAASGAVAGAYAGVPGLSSLLRYSTQFFLARSAPTEAATPSPEWAGSVVRSYRPLGNTGWKMSDISFGSAHVRDADVVRAALDRGINYIDTSPDYSDAESERVVGQAIRGRRDKVFVASKFCTPQGHLPVDSSVESITAAVEGSLSRLGTDYLDLCHVHACNDVERLMAPNFHEAFDRLKEQGKLRFLGVSSHTPELETVMNHAVDSGRFHVIMVAYNFRNWPDLSRIIGKAHDKGVGFVAMKTLKGAYHTVLSDFTPSDRNSFTQAAFKWVSSNPNVSGLVVSISKQSHLDEYLYASGKAATPADLGLLERYDRAVAAEYCRPGCGACLPACPVGLPVDDILRYAMYYEGYGSERVAMTKYARLSQSRGPMAAVGPAWAGPAQACASCAAPCQSACPFDLPIRAKLLKADRLLRT